MKSSTVMGDGWEWEGVQWEAESLTVLGMFRPIPGLNNCAGVIGKMRLSRKRWSAKW